MSLLGIDVGTTGCKVSAFSREGECFASAYEEYDQYHPQPGWAELDTSEVWTRIKGCIAAVAEETHRDPVTAISASSLGEAMVPVSNDRRILGPSILNFDTRGEEFLDQIASAMDDERLYRVNGNTLGNHYGLTKLLWLKRHQPDLFAEADKFLLWGSFVSFMLGADPIVDYSLANRTLLFDVDQEAWSNEFLAAVDVDVDKLPGTAPSGTVIGALSRSMAEELGLPAGAAIVTGAHDQCTNAVGCGVIQEGRAMCGMGTYICICPPFAKRREPALMMERGLNTEHHAVPGLYVSFIYNLGGCMLKWYRDTFAVAEKAQAAASGHDVYADLIAEVPEGPSSVVVLPHFSVTGPPEFISDSSGVIVGLKTETTRGDVLKGILEGTVFYLRECVESLPPTGIHVENFRAVGGGSKSDAWLQICADILGRPVTRARVAEAGALGAAILAGTATDVFSTIEEGVETMVELGRTFEPEPQAQKAYDERFEHYRGLWPTLAPWLREPA